MPEIPAKIIPEILGEVIYEDCEECPHKRPTMILDRACTCSKQPDSSRTGSAWTAIYYKDGIPDWCPLEDAPECSICNGSGENSSPRSGTHVDPMCGHCEGSGVEPITAYTIPTNPALYAKPVVGDDELVLMLDNADLKEQIKEKDEIISDQKETINALKKVNKESGSQYLASSRSVTALNMQVKTLGKINESLRNVNEVLLGLKKKKQKEGTSRKLDL